MKEQPYTKVCHSVYRLMYHAVFVIKYRRKVLTAEIIDEMRDYSDYLIRERYRGKLNEFNGEADHVHVLMELPPSVAPSVVVCNLKTQLSKRVRQKYGDQIKDKLWKDSFWSDSYFLTTTGGANVDVLKVYIQQQGIEKPKRKYVRRK